MKKQILGSLVVIFGLSYLLGTSQFGELGNKQKASESVVYIVNKKQNSGGTGFHVQAPSGQKYILTNGHVCSGVGADGIVYVKFHEEDRPIPRHIVEESPLTDLCLIEPMPSASTATIASRAPSPKDELTAVGHPKLLPLTNTSGSMIGMQIVKVLIAIGIPEGTCEEPKNEKSEIPFFIFSIPVCLLKITAMTTTVPILPGSSGSPVLNRGGQVVGVAFAADSDSNWALVVPLSDIKTFLSNY